MELRPYQIKALNEIRTLYAADKRRVLLHLATGGGKTLVFCQVLKGVAAKGKHAIMVVRGKDLVEQASQRLIREGVPHGVMQGNHRLYRPRLPLQVCSIDTLYARRDKGPPPTADLVVIDEAHYAASKSFRWLMAFYESAYVLGVTATPHVKTGLRHIADHVVYPITLGTLIEQGYLAPPRYYAPTEPKLGGVSIDPKTGDYRPAELGMVMSEAALYGDMVRSYRALADGRPAVCFAVTRDHSKALASMFTGAGIPAEHVEADTPPKQRAAVLERLRVGTTKIVCNVGILCVGVDIPHLGCVILARPTKSYNLFIQQIGRGTRTHAGKADFVVIDHANNLIEHGLIEYELECDLDGTAQGAKRRRPVVCKGCYVAWQPELGEELFCPSCGYDNRRIGLGCSEGSGERKTDVDPVSVMLEVADKEAFMRERALRGFIERMRRTAVRRGYKPGWIYHKIKSKYGEDIANKAWKAVKG